MPGAGVSEVDENMDQHTGPFFAPPHAGHTCDTEIW